MLNERPEWKALAAHRKSMENADIRHFFSEDPVRFRRFSLKYEGLLVDYSRHRITEETMSLLCDLAGACNIEDKRDQLFSGEKINVSENRSVLHSALRRPRGDEQQIIVDGHDIMPSIHDEFDKMETLVNQIREGQWKGYSGKPVTTVISIGIGGSSLGPEMVCEALKHEASDKVSVRFVSNIDPAHLSETLKTCAPETTLFIVASKTFTTQETLANANAAKQWMLERLPDSKAVKHHFIAISANTDAVQSFGIDPENMLTFKNWVGGRYSVWSVIGLPIAISLGMHNFRALLNGGFVMDRHFQIAPLGNNMPVILALLGIWYHNFWDADAYAVIPYAQNMKRFPAFLQQLDMESNGKNTTLAGESVPYKTGPVIFGEPGTDAQHAFMQLFHQGTRLIPCDFIGVIKSAYQDKPGHDKLLENMLAQAQALMQGRTAEESGHQNPHRRFSGNKPSTTILLNRLDAFHLGMLLALYEHKIFVQGVIWDINSFDQWGVELGKELAKNIETRDEKRMDSPTQGLIEHIKAVKEQN